MVYIAADGTVQQGQRPRSVFSGSNGNSIKTTVAAAIVALFAIKNYYSSHPLADGKIPAAEVLPNDHWDRIAKDDSLVRILSSELEGNRDASLERKMKMATNDKNMMSDRADGFDRFGGLDGHRHEPVGLKMDDWQGTRCSSTMGSMTAYFCGKKVALDRDVALKEKSKLPFIGINSFRDFIKCRYEAGRYNGDNHKRSVYRLGIGCQDSFAGYSHAFSIIAQPDGSFMWLQSYIQQYSLPRWMAQSKPDGSPRGKLSYDELLAKLDRIESLMSIDGWDEEANANYLDLFFVDKNKEAMNRGTKSVSQDWKVTHRLEFFSWDEACEYPLPDSLIHDDKEVHQGEEDVIKVQNTNEMFLDDKCQRNAVKEMFGMFLQNDEYME